MIEHRPWGDFRQFTRNETSTVKVITIEPYQRLSLQTHRNRDEEWYVLDGSVTVTLEGRTFTMEKHEELYIYAEQQHRVGNPNGFPVRILEIAYGDFNENDIERFEDDYER